MGDHYGLSCASRQAKLSNHSGCFETLPCLLGALGLLLQSPATLQLRSCPGVVPPYVIAAFSSALETLVDVTGLRRTMLRNESAWGGDPHGERSGRNVSSLNI